MATPRVHLIMHTKCKAREKLLIYGTTRQAARCTSVTFFAFYNIFPVEFKENSAFEQLRIFECCTLKIAYSKFELCRYSASYGDRSCRGHERSGKLPVVRWDSGIHYDGIKRSVTRWRETTVRYVRRTTTLIYSLITF